MYRQDILPLPWSMYWPTALSLQLRLLGTRLLLFPEGLLKQALGAFVAKAAGDISAFKSYIEKWFDDTMDRVSGVYKRWSQLFLLLIGLFLAIS